MISGGLSRARLDRMHRVMNGHIESGAVPGMVTLISRRGDLHVAMLGAMTLGGDEPMRRDTIFRVTSMTKPITAAATMILVEECKLRLDEPVQRWLPELADRRVLKCIDGPLDETVPARRPVSVRDLLTFRLGFGILLRSDPTPIQQATRALELMTIGPPKPWTSHGEGEWLRRFGTLPLMYQPGERWMYGTGSHLLGALIARASGQPLENFLRQRIFEPLGMKDTGFSVPASSRARLASCYQADRATGALTLHDGVQDSQWAHAPEFPDAGAGLVSTVDDYLAFGQMMLGRGKYGRQRLLSRHSVELMTSDQLTAEQRSNAGPFLGDDRGWGFGLSVVTRRGDVASVPGRYGWDGGFGTSWSSDPAEEMVAILMTQRLWDSPRPPAVHLDFWTSVYQAIDD